jgi:hypothetical protein
VTVEYGWAAVIDAGAVGLSSGDVTLAMPMKSLTIVCTTGPRVVNALIIAVIAVKFIFSFLRCGKDELAQSRPAFGRE